MLLSDRGKYRHILDSRLMIIGNRIAEMGKVVVFSLMAVLILLPAFLTAAPSGANVTITEESSDFYNDIADRGDFLIDGGLGESRETPDDWEPPADPVGTTPRSSYKLEKPLNGSCPSLSRACIALCTPPNNTLDKLQFPPIFDSLTMVPSHLDVVMSPDSQNESVSVFVWDPCPDAAKTVYDLTIQQVAIKVLDNGSLYFVHDNRLISSKDYCLILDDGVTAMECNVRTDSWLSRLGQILTLICLFMSVMCTVATLVVYWILPEFNNMHGMIFRSYIASCGFAYLLTLMLNLYLAGSYTPLELQPDVCMAVGFVKHYVFLVNFFWLNVLCYDIWRKFRTLPAHQHNLKNGNSRRFIVRSIYAWGSPLVPTAIGLICALVPSISGVIKPAFSGAFCCFTDPATAALYFDGPVAISNIANIYLFISTARKILQTERDTETELSGDDSQRHANDKQRLYTYMKLFILMGINWTLKAVIVLVNFHNSTDVLPNEIWRIASLIHSLQGIIIFIVFICNDNIKDRLIKRFNHFRWIRTTRL